MVIGASRARGGKDDVQANAGAAYLYVSQQNPGSSKVMLDLSTSPGSGAANLDYVSVEALSVPDGSISAANVRVALADKCHAAPLSTTSAASIVSGSGDSKLLSFLLPAGLTPGQYYVSISDSEEGDANFESSNCAVVNVVR